MQTTNEPRSSVAAEVRAGLARVRATHADVAKILGVSTATVSKKVNGRTSFTVEEVVRLAAFLGVPPSTLLSSLDAA